MIDTPETVKQGIELSQQLVKSEGLKLKPYKCTSGKLTIGVGRNLEARGISKQEAFVLLDNDIAYFRKQCEKYVACFKKLSPQRQNILIDMMFNLGVTGILRFKNMLKYLEKEDFVSAAKEMIDSEWYRQVGSRSARLVKMMVENKYFSEV